MTLHAHPAIDQRLLGDAPDSLTQATIIAAGGDFGYHTLQRAIGQTRRGATALERIAEGQKCASRPQPLASQDLHDALRGAQRLVRLLKMATEQVDDMALFTLLCRSKEIDGEIQNDIALETELVSVWLGQEVRNGGL